MSSILEHCARCLLPVRTFPAGEVIIPEGKRLGSLFFLKEGTVEILKQDVELTTVSCPGAVFGEISVLMKTPHMATVRTVAESSFYVADDAAVLLGDHPEFYEHIACLLANRLTSVSSYLVDLKRQFSSHEDHLGMVDEVLESLLHHQSRTGSGTPPAAA